ncbi:MATE family efflux transporter [Fusobacterium perfoetens]|uniref:MATE family efflux transporter n=1 Tax=Fusobacterium perfoetens TaxID=852 RepID=UPI001F3F7360|nr:MATE family efflux transporter [Fusobacterium perfoetens]MCF2626189.1 MATE family efflux transporter [Fusobacterium perfoetens]
MKSYEMDMCSGPLFRRMLVFTVPLICSGILQLFFNAADIIVVGKFSGEHALAAVGSTSSLINLLLNLVIGVSLGASVIVGRNYGAKHKSAVRKSVHTAIAVALWSGVIMLFIGVLLSPPILKLMGTPDDVIKLSTLYMRIYFLGMPSMMLYNFGASVLRAAGDTRRPLYILAGAGMINIFLNLIFVVGMNLSVAGVALATIVSETISAFMVMRILIKTDGFLHLDIKRIKIHKKFFKEMLKVGLPAGIQGVFFNISNVLIQSSVNSFGSVVMAGNTAAVTLEGFVDTSILAIYQTTLNFTSQNMGARKYSRIGKIFTSSLIMSVVTGLIFGGGTYIFADKLLKICISTEEAISYGAVRLGIVAVSYPLCGIMDVGASILRGMGYSILPTVVVLIGACIFRVVWILTVFKEYHSLVVLYFSYPISWFLTSLILIGCYLYLKRRFVER